MSKQNPEFHPLHCKKGKGRTVERREERRGRKSSFT